MNYVYKHHSDLGRKTIYGLPIYTNEVIHPNIHQEINIFVNSLCLYKAISQPFVLDIPFPVQIGKPVR